MYMQKAMASDFDKTLRFTDEEGNSYFRTEDIEAVTRFQKEGGMFTVCTGRPLYSVIEDLQDNIIPDGYIVSSGAGIYQSADWHDVLYEYCIPAQICAALQKQFGEADHLYMHADGYVSVFSYDRKAYPGQILVKGEEELRQKHVTAISIHAGSTVEAAALREKVRSEFDCLNAFQNGEWIDVVGRGVSKGHGALEYKLLKHIDILGGIGDNFNDVPLLKAADVSFTFKDSPQEVKDIADYLVDSEAEAIRILEKM
jgi:hydroxymethylpyrimidine pyrophosphatase-like HAD family hydrolase